MDNALMAATSTSDMLATNFVLLGKYVRLLVVPYPLSWDYSYNQIPIVSFANVWAIAGLVLYLGLGAYAVVRAKSKDVFAFAILFYLVTLSISSNLFVKIGGHVRGTLALHAVAWVLHCRPSPDREAAGHRRRGKNST